MISAYNKLDKEAQKMLVKMGINKTQFNHYFDVLRLNAGYDTNVNWLVQRMSFDGIDNKDAAAKFVANCIVNKLGY